MRETSKEIEELFNKHLEIVESTSYRISYHHKEKLLSELKKLIEEKDKEIEKLKTIAIAYIRHNKKNQ